MCLCSRSVMLSLSLLPAFPSFYLRSCHVCYWVVVFCLPRLFLCPVCSCLHFFSSSLSPFTLSLLVLSLSHIPADFSCAGRDSVPSVAGGGGEDSSARLQAPRRPGSLGRQGSLSSCLLALSLTPSLCLFLILSVLSLMVPLSLSLSLSRSLRLSLSFPYASSASFPLLITSPTLRFLV